MNQHVEQEKPCMNQCIGMLMDKCNGRKLQASLHTYKQIESQNKGWGEGQ